MGVITANRYTDSEGKLRDAQTGGYVDTSNPAGITPTQSQVDARTGSAGGAGPAADVTKQGQPGYDVFGNPVVDPNPPPVTRYTAPGGVNGAAGALFAPGGAYDATAKPYSADQEAKVRAEERSRVQAQIDAITEASNIELANARAAGSARLGKSRASLNATGQIGSGNESLVTDEVTKKNAAEESAILAMKDAKMGEILSGVANRSKDLIDKQRTLARDNADKYISYLSTVAEQSRSEMTTLAKAGATLNPAQRAALVEQTGYDSTTFDQLYKSLQIANASDIINKDKPQIVGNKAIFFRQTKDAQGNLKMDTVELELPSEIGKTIKDTVARDDGIYVFYTDGTYKKVGEGSNQTLSEGQSLYDANGKLIAKNQKTYAPADGASANGENPQLYNGLSTKTATAVRARVSKYATDNTIQNFSTVQDGYNFAQSLNTKTKNPADDQALIYSLAKALDPASVVREGEYATAQRYAQSWVQAYGNGVTQALFGTGFLSETARKNIKATIEQKFNSQKRSYDQTRGSYITGINALTGRGDGEKFITEFQTPPTVQERAAAAGYDYAAMNAKGYSDQDITDALDQAGQ